MHTYQDAMRLLAAAEEAMHRSDTEWLRSLKITPPDFLLAVGYLRDHRLADIEFHTAPDPEYGPDAIVAFTIMPTEAGRGALAYLLSTTPRVLH